MFSAIVFFLSYSHVGRLFLSQPDLLICAAVVLTSEEVCSIWVFLAAAE